LQDPKSGATTDRS